MRKGGLYIALGDSVTWRIASTFYSALAAKHIGLNYAPIKLINKGIGGATSTDLVTNLNWTGNFCPDIVSIGIGLNDAAGGVSDTTNFINNLKTVIDFYRSKNPDVYIVLCNPHTIDLSVGTRTYLQNFRDAMITVANDKIVAVAHFDLAWSISDVGTYLTDGLHPNNAGHQLLANILIPVLEQSTFVKSLT
jgi:acyl-CoA thioesterase-1